MRWRRDVLPFDQSLTIVSFAVRCCCVPLLLSGVFPSAVSCISLALSDAGIMLYDLVTACQAVSCCKQLS